MIWSFEETLTYVYRPIEFQELIFAGLEASRRWQEHDAGRSAVQLQSAVSLAELRTIFGGWHGRIHASAHSGHFSTAGHVDLSPVDTFNESSV